MRKAQEAKAREWEKLRNIEEYEFEALSVPNSPNDEATNKEVASTFKHVDDIDPTKQEKKR